MEFGSVKKMIKDFYSSHFVSPNIPNDIYTQPSTISERI